MRKFLKRVLDISLACSGIIFFLPFWLLFSFLIWIRHTGSVYYIQERIGKDGKGFRILKFRTMTVNGNVESRFAKILRMTAMDELPQLIAIAGGKMSFVGPRPLVREELEQIKDKRLLKERLAIRPGLTGVAQVLVNKNASLEDKFLYDLWYAKNQSLIIDAELILISFLITFLGRWELDADKLHIVSRLRGKIEL